MSKSQDPGIAEGTRPRVEQHLATAAPARPENCADRAFAEAMIGHYEASIKAARLIQEAGADVSLRWLADAIIGSHQRDLDMLRDWLRACLAKEAESLSETADQWRPQR